MSAAPAPARLEPLSAAPHTPAQVQAALGASDAQMADLAAFRALLEEWNGVMNLVGPSAMAQYWPRHVFDSAQLLALAPQARVWADIGAGAGFPGVILAILLKATPGAQVHLVESQAKRCRFLAAAIERLDLPAQVHNTRAENLALTVDVVTARAVAPLVKLLGYTQSYLKRGATGLFLKGQDIEAELTEATKYWKFEAHLIESLSHTEGRVLQVKGLKSVRKV